MPTSAQAPQGPVTATRVLNSWTGREARLLRQAMRRSVRGFAGYLGMSSRTISNWEAGGLGLTPRPDTQAMLDTALHRSSPQVRERFESLLAETTAISSKGNQSTPDLSAEDLDPALPWTAARMMSSLDDAIDGKPLGRRPGREMSRVDLIAYVHHWGVAGAEPLKNALTGGRFSSSLLHNLQGTVDQLRTLDAGSGGGMIIDVGAAHLLLIFRILRTGSYTETTGRRLAGIAADTAAQTGWFAFDAGQHALAQGYLLASLRAAHVSEDARLGAAALSYIAIQGYSTGHPGDAVLAARAARGKIRSSSTPALEAMLLTREARGHAKLGERQATLRALGRANELYAQGRSENDPHWLYWLNDGELLGQAGSCYFDLGDFSRAASTLIEAARTHSLGEPRTRALLLSRAAVAQVKNGEMESGCITGHESATLAEGINSTRLDDHLLSISEELAPISRSSLARGLIDRVAEAVGSRGGQPS